MEKKISSEAEADVRDVFWGNSIKSDNCGNIDNTIQKFLDKEPIQSPDFRAMIASYNFTDLMKYRVYDIVYQKDNPVKTSLKTFGADAIIQLMIFMKSLGLNIQECIDLGMERMIDRAYESKKKKKR
jgi:hypothetical protein